MSFYTDMKAVATSLISRFGSDCVLRKPDGKPVFNPDTNKNEQRYSEFTGKCVMRPYVAETIGALNNIIKAGDVEFKCVMDDQSVIPTESVDKILFGGILYNIQTVETVCPDGATILVHSLQARRATK